MAKQIKFSDDARKSMMMYLSGMENIRDVLPYPRTPKNLIY